MGVKLGVSHYGKNTDCLLSTSSTPALGPTQPIQWVLRALSPEVKEKNTLRIFEKRVLRRIFGPKRDEVIGGWR
jgi:hypothetical protein